MKTKGVQEGRQTFHHDKNGQSEQGPQHENNGQEDSSDIALALKTQRQDHVPEYLRELCVKKYTELARASPWGRHIYSTYGHEPKTKPTDASKKRCEKWYSERIQWCGWPGG